MRRPTLTTTAMAADDAPGERASGLAPLRALVPAALALAAAACASYAPAPIEPAQSARSFGSRTLDAPELREEVARILPSVASAWPPPAWDRAGLFAVALVRNPDLAVARAEVEAALAHETGAAAPPGATLGLQSEYARREPDHWLYGVSVGVPVRAFGLRRLDVELARLETASSRSRLMERTWSVRRALVAALSDVESAERRIDVLTRLAAAQAGLVEVQRRRVAAGEDAPSDLSIAEVAAIDIEQQQARARADLVAARSALASALGLPSDAIEHAPIGWSDWGDPPALDAAALAASRERALLSRADLAAALGEYAEAETKLKRAVARQYPQIDLKPGYYWDHGIAKWPFDVDFTLPLFDRNQGEIAEATAAREVAARRMLAVQATIYSDIAAALATERSARASLDVASRRAAVARRQLEHAELAFRAGATDSLERAAAQVVVLRAELESVEARAGLQSARNALEDAVHAPLSGPELALTESGADR